MNKEKLFLKFVYDDNTTKVVEVSKFTTLRKDVPQVMLHLDQLKDGNHLLIMNETLLQVDADRKIVAKLEKIEVVRE